VIRRSSLRTLDRIVSALGRCPARAAHLALGCRGEDEAFFYLRKLGFVIVARDFRSPPRGGDIDLIAWDKDVLCFIEVKARSRRNSCPPKLRSIKKNGRLSRRSRANICGSATMPLTPLLLFLSASM